MAAKSPSPETEAKWYAMVHRAKEEGLTHAIRLASDLALKAWNENKPDNWEQPYCLAIAYLEVQLGLTQTPLDDAEYNEIIAAQDLMREAWLV